MSWLSSQWMWIASLAVLHFRLSLIPVVVGFVLSLPLGWLANRCGRGRSVFLAVVSVIYAIPSLPLLIALPSAIGTRILDPLNLEIILTLYALALMTRTSADALRQVDRQAIDGAQSMGMSPVRLFFTVRLPLAGPVMLSGLRVVAASTVSLVTVGSLIGIDSLGTLFTEGYQRSYIFEIMTGVVLTLLVALVLDGLLVGIGKLLMPWTRLKTTHHTHSSHSDSTAEMEAMA
jgi:osmoprotectant transport system permease protein